MGPMTLKFEFGLDFFDSVPPQQVSSYYHADKQRNSAGNVHLAPLCYADGKMLWLYHSNHNTVRQFDVHR